MTSRRWCAVEGCPEPAHPGSGRCLKHKPVIYQGNAAHASGPEEKSAESSSGNGVPKDAKGWETP